MLSQIQASYHRVESSLQRLTDSISAYNTSTTAGEELLAADEAVDRDIEQLVEHQKNVVRLEKLRRTADALDEQIKNTLRLLADTRKEIQSIPTSDNSEARRQINVEDFLSYAKFIAKTTVPPTLRKPLDFPPKPLKDEGADAQITNGIATPPRGVSRDVDSLSNMKGVDRALNELDENNKAWLMPTNLPFDPWPNGDAMRRGVLGKIQKMLEDGTDPAGVLSAEEQALVDRKKREEEERKAKDEEEKQRRAREEMGYGPPSRRQTVVAEPFNPDDL